VVFPYRFKISIAKPLFMKGDKTSMTNYGSISVLMVFSKVLDKVMYNRLSHHMHTNIILVPDQFGFRQGKSTQNAAFKLTDTVLIYINQKMHGGGIFCDLAKASDCVNHEILLVKLHYYGIQRTVANWFGSYLTNSKEKGKLSKVKLFLCLAKHHTMKTYGGSVSISPRILDLVTRCR
jgi:hypothetical protein